MSALSTVGGTRGCGALAPGQKSSVCSPSGCASVQVVGSDSLQLLSRTWTLAHSGADQADVCPLVDGETTRLHLPKYWLTARVAAFEIAEDASSLVTYSWAIVVGAWLSDAPRNGAENVWVGRFEGSRRDKLCHWGGFWCPAVDNAFRVKNQSLSNVRVSVLDGPMIGIGCFGEVWIARLDQSRDARIRDTLTWNLELVQTPTGVRSFGTLLCSASVESTNWTDSLLCVGTIEDDDGCLSRALLTISAESLTCRVVGYLKAAAISDNIFVCDATYDVWLKHVVVVWSSGLISWVSIHSAKCLHSLALPRSAGIPLVVRIGVNDKDVMITCATKSDAANSEQLETWAVRRRENDEERSESLVPCFKDDVWRGKLGPYDFVLSVLPDHAFRKASHTKGCLIAVQVDPTQDNQDQTPSYVIGSLPWDSVEGSATSAPLAKIQQRLSLRLQAGLKSLVEANVVAKEKQNLAFHLRHLLSQIADGIAGPRAQQIFRAPLEVALERPLRRKRSQHQNESEGVDFSCLDGRDTGLMIPGTPRRDDELLRVRKLEHFLDPSGLYLVVALNATVVGIKSRYDSAESATNSGQEAVWIEVQISAVIDVPWESNEMVRGREDQLVTLVSRGSLRHLVSSCEMGLSDLRADVRAISRNGRGQALGSFSISPHVLSGRLRVHRRIPEWCALEYNNFIVNAMVISHGGSIPGTKDCERSCSSERSGVRVRVNAGESYALFQVEAPGGLALATAAAEIVSSVPDNVRFRLAPIAEPRVHTLDASWRALTDELTATREFARKRGPLYEPLLSLLEHQIMTDEAVGLMEESYIGVL